MTIKIYTDGACSENPGPGGWAAIIIENEKTEYFGSEMSTTNNRMEMTAAIKALEFIINEDNKPIEIYSDSAYLINCFLQGWYKKWEQNGWRNSKGNPVENKDLWKKLLELNEKYQITWIKVKGHSDNELNNRCDLLAKSIVPRK